ncbi:Outer membrane lipoprotein [Lishizhenia tianjinensis]|uniref:Outer membrane lipoprotein n=1 Tax=Lishizhenia tianjinensis TaxID=477690 RepID=A0A1I6X8F4_9FLAO|nr:outer membrane protein assembly factor BamD [Lishizhenia tianjinensis]SFT34567.1 Outer membrane lipoprotein [Lishizhenia tianjinensis]
MRTFCKPLLFLILITLPSLLYAQNNEQQAFQTYKKARAAYESQNFHESARLLKETKSLLGSTNIRIQPMYIKSLVQIENWQEAKNEIAVYYGLNPDQNLVEFQEIKKLELNVNQKVNSENSTYTALMRVENNLGSSISSHENLAAQYKNYLAQYPKALHKSEVENKLTKLNDKIAYLYAQQGNSTASYERYLSKYPYGIYAQEAKSKRGNLDQDAYQTAKNKATAQAYRDYLYQFPKGKYRTEVQSLLNNQLDEDAYKKASNSNSITDYESYARNFPNGKYITRVNHIIQNSYFKWANEAFDRKNYSTAKNYYQVLDSRYPYGKYAPEVKKQLQKCNRRLNQRGAEFLMYSYDSLSPIGLTYGQLNTNRLGYYWTFKMNANIFKGFDVLYEIDDSGNTDSSFDTKRTFEYAPANICFSYGMTFKIVYPLWGTIGLGGGYFPTYEMVDKYYSDGDFYESEWMKNTDRTSWNLFPEVGLNLKVGNSLMLKYGVLYKDNIIHQFGFGFQL